MAEHDLGTVKLGYLKNMIASVERSCNLKKPNDLDLTFEYIVGSLYPQVYDNMKKALLDEHTKGYIEGYNAAKGEDKNEV